MDQASTLRNRKPNPSPDSPTHVLTVSSGKGGVGKSNFVLNVGIALARYRKRILAMDADMGLGNIDILVGAVARHNLMHVLQGEKALEEVLIRNSFGIDLLPTASGVEWMTSLSSEQKMGFLQKMDALNGHYDVLLIDTGAGISPNVLYFNLAAQTRIVMVSPEPTSLTDAYALIKVLSQNHRQKHFEIVANSVSDEQEGLEVYRNLTAAADRFLDVRLGYLGHVVRDDALPRAVRMQRPVTEVFPDSAVARCYRTIARRLTQLPVEPQRNGLGLFWRQVVGSAAAEPS